MIRWSVLAAALAVVIALPHVAARAAAPVEKSIFVSVLDATGKPVKDMAPDEFMLREDRVDREIVSVKPATQPLNIELLADTTTGVTDILQDARRALTGFVKQVYAGNAEASIALMEFGQASVMVTPFTSSPDDLVKGINKLIGKPSAGSVLLEAIVRASSDLAKRPSPRRAIVLFNLEPSDEQSSDDPRRILEALRKSTAQVWAVSLQRGGLANPKRDVILNQVARVTGGAREYIVDQAALESYLKRYADALTSQYEVTYKRTEPNKPVEVQIGTTRQGVQLHASGFAPQ